MNLKKLSSKEIAGLAVLLALVIVLQVFGGVVSIGAVQLNFTLIPIVLGAVIYGAYAGAFLGFVSGFIVLTQVISGLVPFYTIIWANDPIVTALTCLVKTTVAGWLSGIIYRLLEKKNDWTALFVASAIVPIVNTALFIVGCLFMTSVQSLALSDGKNILVYILVGLVTFNFFFELAVNLLLSPSLYRVLGILRKAWGVRKKSVPVILAEEVQEIEETTEETEDRKVEDVEETTEENVNTQTNEENVGE